MMITITNIVNNVRVIMLMKTIIIVLKSEGDVDHQHRRHQEACEGDDDDGHHHHEEYAGGADDHHRQHHEQNR